MAQLVQGKPMANVPEDDLGDYVDDLIAFASAAEPLVKVEAVLKSNGKWTVTPWYEK